MKGVMEAVENLYKPHRAEEKKPLNANANAIAERLWQRLLELYGRQWESAYGHVDGDAFPVWRDAIAKMTIKQIKNGLDALIVESSEYPPNLIEFLKLCKTVVPAYHRKADLASLPPPNVHRRPEVIAAKEKHFAEVRKLSG